MNSAANTAPLLPKGARQGILAALMAWYGMMPTLHALWVPVIIFYTVLAALMTLAAALAASALLTGCVQMPTSGPVVESEVTAGADDVPGINRCQFFGSFNTSKLSLHLNLKHPGGHAALLKLIEKADVLIWNVRPPAMARLRAWL